MRVTLVAHPSSSPQELRDRLRKAGVEAFVVLGRVIAVTDRTDLEEAFACRVSPTG